MSAAEQLSEQQLALYKAAFAIIDRNGDGFISVDELGSIMRSLGRNPSDADVREMIHEVDEDGNDRMDMTEFLTLMLRKTSEADQVEEIREAFRVFDRDGDGFISAGELRQAMSGLLGVEMSAAEAEEMVRLSADDPAEAEHKLLISFEEFYALATEN